MTGEARPILISVESQHKHYRQTHIMAKRSDQVINFCQPVQQQQSIGPGGMAQSHSPQEQRHTLEAELGGKNRAKSTSAERH